VKKNTLEFSKGLSWMPFYRIFGKFLANKNELM
jgi:hypothetical protein